MTAILVTGAEGFVGRNLTMRLKERGLDVIGIGRGNSLSDLAAAAGRADFVVHLGGVNRPSDPAEFQTGNAGFTTALCDALAVTDNGAPIAYSSSTQADLDNPYGASKREAENILLAHGERTGAAIHLYRLPNIFGKWARPNYNSAVATFCHNVAQGLPITVHDPAAPLRLVYVDDVVDDFLALLDSPTASGFRTVEPTYETTVGSVAAEIESFPATRDTLVSPQAGTGLTRALYATYLTYLPAAAFAYNVPIHGSEDPRGIFVEMLKTSDSGQFSYFIAHPGVTRGDHYHHTKTEKFLVIAGTAHFGFRHVVTGAHHELVVEGGSGTIVETIPGWTHNITNIGDNDLVCMLWANEIFDRTRPDTIWMKV